MTTMEEVAIGLSELDAENTEAVAAREQKTQVQIHMPMSGNATQSYHFICSYLTVADQKFISNFCTSGLENHISNCLPFGQPYRRSACPSDLMIVSIKHVSKTLL